MRLCSFLKWECTLCVFFSLYIILYRVCVLQIFCCCFLVHRRKDQEKLRSTQRESQYLRLQSWYHDCMRHIVILEWRWVCFTCRNIMNNWNQEGRLWCIEYFDAIFNFGIIPWLQSGHSLLPHPLTFSLTMTCFGQCHISGSYSMLVPMLEIKLSYLFLCSSQHCMSLPMNGTDHVILVCLGFYDRMP